MSERLKEGKNVKLTSFCVAIFMFTSVM